MRFLSCHDSLPAHTRSCLSGCKRATITCEPENRPEGELIQLTYPGGTLLEDTGDGLREAYTEYPVQGISQRVFYIACSTPSQQIRDLGFTAQHSVNQCSDVAVGTAWNVSLSGPNDINIFREETKEISVVFMPQDLNYSIEVEIVSPIGGTLLTEQTERRLSAQAFMLPKRTESRMEDSPFVEATYSDQIIDIRDNIREEWEGSYLDDLSLKVHILINEGVEYIDDLWLFRSIHLKKYVDPLRDKIIESGIRKVNESITSIPVDSMLDYIDAYLEVIHFEGENGPLQTTGFDASMREELLRNLRPEFNSAVASVSNLVFGEPIPTSIQHGLFVDESWNWEMSATISTLFEGGTLRFNLLSGNPLRPEKIGSVAAKWVLNAAENGLEESLSFNRVEAGLEITGTSNTNPSGILSDELRLHLALSSPVDHENSSFLGSLDFNFFLLINCLF